jgi:hypothetical protein
MLYVVRVDCHGAICTDATGDHTHGRALRSVADGLINVACDMLRTATIFDLSLANQNVAC